MPTIMRVGGGAGGGKSSNPEISTIAEGKTLLITENGILVEYYIAKHGYEPELNVANITLLVRKEGHSERQWNATNSSVVATSDILEWMNGDFFNSLSSGVRELIVPTKFKYTIGGSDYSVSTMERKVFPLSVTELGFSSGYANVEGSALPIAETLKIATAYGVAIPQWTRTPYKEGGIAVHYLDTTGALAVYNTSYTRYARTTFCIPSNAKVVGPDEYGRYSLDAETVSDVYGIARDITAQSPAWARSDKSIGLTATASVGTVAGASDFDNIYPWSEMKRVTLDTGDVMVRIPKFYYGRYRNGNIERIQISGRADVGLSLHPAFNHGGVEKDFIYVGAYKTSSNNKSVSGAAPQVSQTRATMRTNAKAKGNGWGIIDISTLSAIQMLYLVEFSHNNSQQTVGRGYCDDNSAAINTGSCDVVPNLTGRPAGTDGKTDIVYRGIEGIWGNVWEWVDGFVMVNGAYYVCNNPAHYADSTTNYTGMANSEQLNRYYSGSYIIKTSMDSANSHIMTPNTAGASETTNYCDAVWGASGTKVYAHGGGWGRGSVCGMFAADLGAATSGYSPDIGSRLIYIP